MKPLRVFTAFSGYDSQCMALDRIGLPYDLVGWSEIDKHAIAAHNAIYPQFAESNYGDISKIDWSQVPDFDLFTYSSPCQDFSVAGLQRGGTKGSGTRSSLLWECERAIAAKRPKYLLFENVAALVSAKFVKLFNQWQLLLEHYGYTNFTQVLNAKDYGVPQNRECVFMVSILNCDKPYYFPQPIPLTKRLRDVLEDNVPERYYLSDDKVRAVADGTRLQQFLHDNQPNEQDGIDLYSHRYFTDIHPTITTRYNAGNNTFIKNRRESIRYDEQPNGNIRGYITYNNKPVGEVQYIHPDNIADTLITAHEPKVIERTDGFRLRKLTPKECFRLMGVSDTDADKMIGAVSKSRCYQLAGNSIVVDVLAAIFSQLFIGNTNTNQQLTLV